MKKTRKALIYICAIIALAISLMAIYILIPKGLQTAPLYAPEPISNKSVSGRMIIDVPKSEMQEIPSSLELYEMKPLLHTTEGARSLAKKLGISSDVIKDGNTNKDQYDYSLRDGERGLSYNSRTGEFAFHDFEYFGNKNVGLPSESESVEIAEANLKDLGLMPLEAYVVSTGGIEEQQDVKGVISKYLIQREVQFSTRASNYKVVGPGMTILVALGTNGKLIGIISTMKKLVEYKKYSVKTLDEAKRDAEKGKGTMNLHPEVKNPKVTKIELLYYADPKRNSRYLQPVYCYSGPDTCIYVPALK